MNVKLQLFQGSGLVFSKKAGFKAGFLIVVYNFSLRWLREPQPPFAA